MTRAAILLSSAMGRPPVITPSGGTITAALLTASGVTVDGSSATTASVSITAGRAYIVAIHVNHFSGTWAATLSGAGQTWTNLGSADAGTYKYRIFGVTSAASVNGSGALTITYGATFDTLAWQVLEYTPSAGFAITFGTIDHAAEVTSATSITDTTAAVDANDYLAAFTFKFNDGSFSGLTGTPRAGWTETGEFSIVDNTWGAFVHSQISPVGGETTVSTSGLASGTYRMATVPLILT